MSGEGKLCNDPTEAAQARCDERASILRFGRTHVAGFAGLVSAGKVPADDASQLADRMNAFLEMIEQGLHDG